ncbi:MAG: lysophospholipid acyltransferase family protein [Candidatus Omnitrophota bacterium]
MFFWPGRFLCWLFLRLFFHLKVEDAGHVPARGGFILAGNHVSYLDPVAFGVACPRGLYFMAKDSLFKGIFACILRSVHAFPLKRNSADVAALKKALKLLKTGKGIFLFPEGTRTVGGTLGQPRTGVGFLMRKSGVPVVPAYVEGTDRALPKTGKRFHSAHIKVTFGEPFFPFSGGLSDEEVSRKVMDRISELKARQQAKMSR